MRLTILAALAAGVLCAAEDGAPRIAGVSAPNLAPGAILRIAGSGLGPTQGCEAKADPVLLDTPNPHNPDLGNPLNPLAANQWVYPKELCGVQVLIDDEPAGLAWVSAGQINLKLPQDSPESGTAALRIVYQGRSSDPLEMPAGWGKTTVALAEPAYVGMPVWLKVSLRYGLGHVVYPAAIGRAGFWCHQVEVRREGIPLPMIDGSDWTSAGGAFSLLSGEVCGSVAPKTAKRAEDRLPLHLLYRFDRPGTYEVRYTLQGLGGRTAVAQSDWTPIEILPAGPQKRRDYLDTVRMGAATDPGEVLTDVLPGVLGYPDDDSLDIVISYLKQSSQAVRRYARSGLSYWPKDRVLQALKAQFPELKDASDDAVTAFLNRVAH